ncbi:MAG: hypothetical protein ABIK37_04445 [candidate division WOR-3 bacterium]
MSEERWPLAGDPSPVVFSGPGRLFALLLTLPCLFLLDRPLDLAVAFILAAACWLAAGQGSSLLPTLTGFLWFGPGIVLVNSLVGSQPRYWGLLSADGARFGLLLVMRLVWATVVAHSLIRTCPREELVATLHALSRFLRIPERHALTVFFALELLPTFSTIRARELRSLPQAIADRIAACDNLAASITGSLPLVPIRFRPADALLLIFAAGLVVLAALV